MILSKNKNTHLNCQELRPLFKNDGNSIHKDWVPSIPKYFFGEICPIGLLEGLIRFLACQTR